MLLRLYRIIILKAFDFFTIIGSFIFSYFLWGLLQSQYPKLFGHAFNIGYYECIIVLLSSILCILGINYNKSYSHQRFTSIETELNKIIPASIIGSLSALAFIFIFRIYYVPRTLVCIIFIILSGFLFIERMLLFYCAKLLRQKGKYRNKLLIVGTDKRAIDLIDTIRIHFGWGLDLIGIITLDSKKVGTQFHGVPVLSTIKGMSNIIHSQAISEVIITISTRFFNHIRNVILICEEETVQVRLSSYFFGSLNKRLKIDYVYDIPFISIMQSPQDNIALFIKRLLDIIFSLILLVLFSPVFLVIALLIKFTSKGPVLYDWNVVGLNRKPFKSWKFRTMIPEADKLKEKLITKNEMKGPVFKIKNDPRITSLGKILRKYSLDELPQLISVLKGDMSLVGPRPVFPNELKKYKIWHRRKLSIKPGITCLWQVSGRNEINDFDKWVKLDLEYIDNWSIFLDLKILFKTIWIVFTGKGAH